MHAKAVFWTYLSNFYLSYFYISCLKLSNAWTNAENDAKISHSRVALECLYQHCQYSLSYAGTLVSFYFTNKDNN